MRLYRNMLAGLACWLVAVAATSQPVQAADPAETAKSLITVLAQSEDPERRWMAAEELGALGPVTDGVVPALVEAAIWDGQPAVRGRAAEALGRIGPVDDSVVPALADALAEDGRMRVRWRAAEALGRIGPATDAVAPALVEAMRTDGHPGVRARAARSLGAMAGAAELAAPALVAALRDQDHAGVRRSAAQALEDLAARLSAGGARAPRGALEEALSLLEADADPEIAEHAAAVRHALRHWDEGAAPGAEEPPG